MLWKQPKIFFPPIWDMVFPKRHHLSRIKLHTKDYQQLQNTTDVVKQQWLTCANRWQHFTNLHKDCKICKINTNEPKDIWLNILAQTLRKRKLSITTHLRIIFRQNKYWQASFDNRNVSVRPCALHSQLSWLFVIINQHQHRFFVIASISQIYLRNGEPGAQWQHDLH